MSRVSDMAMDQQQEGVDELLCEIDHWKGRADDAEKLLRQFLRAYGTCNVQLSSAEIDAGDPDIPPHPWHEEWLHLVRTFLDWNKP